jgi:hypothetical protein
VLQMILGARPMSLDSQICRFLAVMVASRVGRCCLHISSEGHCRAERSAAATALLTMLCRFVRACLLVC